MRKRLCFKRKKYGAKQNTQKKFFHIYPPFLIILIKMQMNYKLFSIYSQQKNLPAAKFFNPYVHTFNLTGNVGVVY